MSNLAEKIRDINLLDLCRMEGVELRRSGNRYMGRCPFHEDKTPSFSIKANHFRCYGCGISGDSVDFVRELKGLSFRAACHYLGLETKRPTTQAERKEIKVRVQERKRKKELVETFRAWECSYSTKLGRAIRRSYTWIRKYIRCPDDLEGKTGDMLVEIYRHLPLWEDRLQTLACGSDAEKFEIYKGLTNEK